jgi:16S rRNA G966 N2-methylase RsmD
MSTTYKIKPKKLMLKEQLSIFQKSKDFDFKGSDTQSSTHALHTYVAAMVPKLAETLIKKYVPEGQKILDPFCGGGAVLVEAVRNGRRAVGTDINPLATLISKVKATYQTRKSIEEACNYVLDAAIRGVNGSVQFPEKYNVEYWFFPHTIIELSSLQRVILSCEKNKTFNKGIIDVLKVIFSSSIRDVMLTYRNEVRLRRFEISDLKKFRPNAFISFANRSKIGIHRISSLPRTAKAVTLQIPVQELSFHDKEFHSIICSPPYGDERNGVSYLQFSKLMLYWLDFPRESINSARQLTLGSKKTSDVQIDSPNLEKAFKSIQQISGSKNGYEFYQDYFIGLKQMVRVTTDYIIIVIGDRILKTVAIKNGLITTELMTSLGCKLVKHYQRTLPSKRLPKLRRESNHGFGGAIDKEDILIFKPINL